MRSCSGKSAKRKRKSKKEAGQRPKTIPSIVRRKGTSTKAKKSTKISKGKPHHKIRIPTLKERVGKTMKHVPSENIPLLIMQKHRQGKTRKHHTTEKIPKRKAEKKQPLAQSEKKEEKFPAQEKVVQIQQQPESSEEMKNEANETHKFLILKNYPESAHYEFVKKKKGIITSVLERIGLKRELA